MSKLVVEETTMQAREKAIHAEIKKKLANKESAQALKSVEQELSKASKDSASMESKLRNREKELQSQREGQKKSQHQLVDLRKQVDEKQALYLKEKEAFDKLASEDAELQKEIEQLQWAMQAVTAGVCTTGNEGESKSMREQLLEVQTKLQEMDAEHAKKTMAATHIQN
eukprot:520298-Amphidinium_carterae.1